MGLLLAVAFAFVLPSFAYADTGDAAESARKSGRNVSVDTMRWHVPEDNAFVCEAAAGFGDRVSPGSRGKESGTLRFLSDVSDEQPDQKEPEADARNLANLEIIPFILAGALALTWLLFRKR